MWLVMHSRKLVLYVIKYLPCFASASWLLGFDQRAAMKLLRIVQSATTRWW